MNKALKDKLRQLRESVPVGMRHGLVLLERCGDVEKAEREFRGEMLELVVAKTGVDRDVAAQHLFASDYELHRALKSLDEERYTLTQRILRKHKDKEDALGLLVHAVVEKYGIERSQDIWLNRDQLQALSPPVRSFLIIMEWLNYESWEDFPSALCLHLETLTHHVESVLDLPMVARILRLAGALQDSYHRGREDNILGYVEARNACASDVEFQRYEDEFQEHRSLLLDRLSQLIEDNLDSFP